MTFQNVQLNEVFPEGWEVIELEHKILRATYYGDLDEVKAAVREFPQSVNLVHDVTGSTALQFAAGMGNYSIVEFLLTCEHIDLRAKDALGLDAFDKACMCGHPGVVKLLEEAIWPFLKKMRAEPDEPDDPIVGVPPAPSP